MLKKGKFIVVDGLDGAGKSVFLDTLINEFKKDNKRVFDTHEFWEKEDRLPYSDETGSYDVIYTSEPTFYGTGKIIRNTLISKSSKIRYSTKAIAQAYSLDRQVLYEGLNLPCLNRGQHVIQSRSVSTSLVYQKITGREDGMSFEEVINLPGNRFALKHAPDFLVILTVEPEEIIKRLNGRAKQDNAIFEKLDFQKKIKKEFESEWFKNIFERQGTKVIYMDASKTIDYSRQQMIHFYNKYLKNKRNRQINIPNRMTFAEYQRESRKTAKYPNAGNNFIYPSLGLCGEAGEVAEKIKKIIRDKNGIIDSDEREKIKKELGDVLWYISQLATELNLSVEEIAKANLEKLFSRLERDVICGSGDDR